MKILNRFQPHITLRKRGFSLVETLVYLAVMVLMVTACIGIFSSLNTILARNAVERELTTSASVTLERMLRDLRAADIVDLTPSTFNVSPGTLTLVQGTTTTAYTLTGGSVFVTVNGASPYPLTGDQVTVDSLVFSRYATSTIELVRVALTLSTHAKAASSTRTFYTSGVLRGAYE